MPSIILKKTFKSKPSGFKIANEKSFTFHDSMTPTMVELVNQKLTVWSVVPTSYNLAYFAAMNHEFQKYHEEDSIVAILDIMEEMGFGFKFQYDMELNSEKISGASYTKRELFIFNK